MSGINMKALLKAIATTVGIIGIIVLVSINEMVMWAVAAIFLCICAVSWYLFFDDIDNGR